MAPGFVFWKKWFGFWRSVLAFFMMSLYGALGSLDIGISRRLIP